jgi:5-methylcytosine-specific restriction endonuclease McrBC regulatory subunit McrC
MCIQSLEEVPIRAKKNMGFKKCRIARLFKTFEKVLKKCTKTLISKNVMEMCTFFTLTYVHQIFFA